MSCHCLEANHAQTLISELKKKCILETRLVVIRCGILYVQVSPREGRSKGRFPQRITRILHVFPSSSLQPYPRSARRGAPTLRTNECRRRPNDRGICTRTSSCDCDVWWRGAARRPTILLGISIFVRGVGCCCWLW